MPAKGGEPAVIRRLALLLEALGPHWSSRDQLVGAVGYVENDENAGRMLRADLEALRALGFEIERSEGHLDPHWRLTGHKKYGR